MTEITWTPAISVIGKGGAEVALIPSQGNQRAAKIIAFDLMIPGDRDRITARAFLELFHLIRMDPPGDLEEIARDAWARLDARDRPKPP